MVSQERISEFLGRAKAFHYSVAPRFTCGSPAQVDEATALRVAEQEEFASEGAREGIYGEADRTAYATKGMTGIAELRIELPRSKGWKVLDLITGETFERLVKR
jgi:hypothetical protein